MRKIYALLLLVLFCVPGVSARAQEQINDAGAAALKTYFEGILKRQQANFEAKKQGQQTLIHQGEISVEAADTYYAITFPHMSMTDANGDKLDLGILSMNAIPDETPGRYKMTMALPTSIVGTDKTGGEILRISIGEQNASGLWDKNIENFIKLDALYKNIRVAIDNQNTLVNIPAMHILYNLTEDASGRFSGPMHFEAANVTLTEKTQQNNLQLQKISLHSELDSFEAAALKNMDMNDPIKLATSKLADGLAMTLSVEGFKSNEGELQNGTLSFQYDNALTGKINATLKAGFAGLKNNDPALAQDFLPQTGNLNITHYNIPLQTINEALQNTGNGADPQLMGFALLLKLPAILAQAESYIEVKDTTLKGTNFETNLSGIVRADITAANSATVDGNLNVTGLENIISNANAAAASDNKKFPLTGFAKLLERIKPFAKKEQTPDGATRDSFHFELNKNGQFLINDQSTTGLLSGGAPTEAPPPAE